MKEGGTLMPKEKRKHRKYEKVTSTASVPLTSENHNQNINQKKLDIPRHDQ